MTAQQCNTRRVLEILAAALQDARVLVLQHEGLDGGPHQGLHLLSLLCTGRLHQAHQHVQRSLYKNTAVLIGMRDDGS